MSSASQPARALPAPAIPAGRTPLAHLLHALNQPLTGLQCSLELGAAGPQRSEQYVRILREGLELTGRMRVLVEAIRELTELKPADEREIEPVAVDALVRAAVDDLVPVAEAKRVRLGLAFQTVPPVAASRSQLNSLLFRTFESALSLTREGGDLRISCDPADSGARLELSWSAGPAPANSPFSPAELGLLVAQAGWQQVGAEWSLEGDVGRPKITIGISSSTSASSDKEKRA